MPGTVKGIKELLNRIILMGVTTPVKSMVIITVVTSNITFIIFFSFFLITAIF